jgi:4-hydroxy-tetrahydrodipicolinate synthase
MNFSGIHAILYALFDSAEQLDRLAMRRQAETCLLIGRYFRIQIG